MRNSSLATLALSISLVGNAAEAPETQEAPETPKITMDGGSPKVAKAHLDECPGFHPAADASNDVFGVEVGAYNVALACVKQRLGKLGLACELGDHPTQTEGVWNSNLVGTLKPYALTCTPLSAEEIKQAEEAESDEKPTAKEVKMAKKVAKEAEEVEKLAEEAAQQVRRRDEQLTNAACQVARTFMPFFVRQDFMQPRLSKYGAGVCSFSVAEGQGKGWVSPAIKAGEDYAPSVAHHACDDLQLNGRRTVAWCERRTYSDNQFVVTCTCRADKR